MPFSPAQSAAQPVYRHDRVEMKFFLSAAQRERLMPELLPRLRPDEYAVTGAHYPVVSLYYDSPGRDCYFDNLWEIKSRRKLRVRLYGSLDGVAPPSCFAEVKHKLDGRTAKRRARLELEHALAVAAGQPVPAELDFGEQRIVEEIHHLVRERQLEPCCCLRYDRHAYASIDPEEDLRVTFDTGIAYRFHRLTLEADDRDFSEFLYEEGASIMEVKVISPVPYWFARLLGQVGCLMQSHSKYCLAMEAGDPILREKLRGRPALF